MVHTYYNTFLHEKNTATSILLLLIVEFALELNWGATPPKFITTASFLLARLNEFNSRRGMRVGPTTICESSRKLVV